MDEVEVERRVPQAPKYHKIHAPYKRYTNGPNKGQFIKHEFSRPWIGMLIDVNWIFQEKIDGTNIRINFVPGQGIRIGGRTDRAQLHPDLVANINALFHEDVLGKMGELWPAGVCIYGEGYGAGIQKGGCYRPDKSFIAFDVRVPGHEFAPPQLAEEWILGLGLDFAPIVGIADLQAAEEEAREGITSTFGDFEAEGYILKHHIPLRANGERCILKVKCRDYRPAD